MIIRELWKGWTGPAPDQTIDHSRGAVSDSTGEKIAYLGYCGPIDSSGVSKIAATLNTAVNDSYHKIYLCLSSIGGYVGDGIYLYHHIIGLPLEVSIHNTGTVASIATTIFVAGKRRLCSPNSIFMMHPITIGSPGELASEPLQAALDATLKDETRTECILRERTKIPEEVLLARRAKAVYLTAQQAFDYGLVHEISDFTLPPGNQIFQI